MDPAAPVLVHLGRSPVTERRARDRIVALPALLDALSALRARGGRVVFTNGCFDLLHPGHVTYLEAARDLGDALVVGLNSDASVQRLKGPTRPVLTQDERATVLAGLRSVDYVTIFEEDTPLRLIAALVPEVLVKGGDWPVDAIVGADVVLAAGGEVLSLPFVEGKSTTGIVERVLRAGGP
ncbi:MAG: D-glycero-beta-D-manno-heptose 1-phosphate adenylyltransferase [Deltaproteobacteria bacterium]|nr:D-glycero-beta-D-manno-heptose 1-phosphate adenylyltransferase [Deltaproteobacteria bacterium]